ncbi:SIR2 family NAD-dependent protein deacylase [Hoyosella altamirensis]|uniref:NAD-dependent protein deacylase n=1 Tax=Hoyosella altamirensis TaxID=616997 RepID=A0A839RH58_9ACTN|nr:NAD-dependent deacylase [Hoyosella altamirensis]MBB3036062.1 NAD-dependent deacetylase [Hoyosella altamirensis]
MAASSSIPDFALEVVKKADSITVLSGAGMSAESGVPTFRDAQTGLWERFDAAALATPEAWNRDPDFVWSWYMWRHHLVRATAPHAGHLALAQWEHSADVTIVTQNVDDLHERAGSSHVHHLHGSLFHFRCAQCSFAYSDEVDDSEPHESPRPPPRCQRCGGQIRPDVVWFGEMLPSKPWEAGVQAVDSCDVLLVVGTSGLVYPAAGLPQIAHEKGIPTIEINPDETPLSRECTVSLRMSAATALPILARSR